MGAKEGSNGKAIEILLIVETSMAGFDWLERATRNDVPRKLNLEFHVTGTFDKPLRTREILRGLAQLFKIAKEGDFPDLFADEPDTTDPERN